MLIIFTIMKVILTIILIPIKVLFFIFAYIIRAITYMISILLLALSVPLEMISGFVSAFMVLGAAVVTVVIVNQISSGAINLSSGAFLIAGIWITSILLVLLVMAMEKIAEALSSFGELMTDWAKSNWFAFW